MTIDSPFCLSVTSECFNRGASPISPGFPLKTCGNDGLRKVAICGEPYRLRRFDWNSTFVFRILLSEERAVTKIFWVTCPQCNGEFYCHYQELRHKKIKLLCPYCSHQFLDEESSKIVE